MKKKHISIIEDNEELAAALKDILLEEEYDVSVYSKPQPTNVFAQNGKYPDLFLIDAWFENKKLGIAQAQSLLQLKKNKKIRVVILSSDHTVENDIKDLGISCFIQKPFQITTLLNTIEVALNDSDETPS